MAVYDHSIKVEDHAAQHLSFIVLEWRNVVELILARIAEHFDNLNGANIQQVFRSSICSHFADHLWKHVKAKVGWPVIRKKIEKLGVRNHHSGEGPIAQQAVVVSRQTPG